MNLQVVRPPLPQPPLATTASGSSATNTPLLLMWICYHLENYACDEGDDVEVGILRLMYIAIIVQGVKWSLDKLFKPI